MKISIFPKRGYIPSMVLIAAMLLLVGTPTVLLAGGEPGTGCDGEFKYDPPPFVGDLTLIWSETDSALGLGEVTATGIVTQGGSADCEGVFDNTLIVENITLDQFLAWDAKLLKGTCIENQFIDGFGWFPFPCYEYGALFSVVAVGGIQWMGGSFSAKFVIMPLK